MSRIISQVIGRNITIDISERVYTNKDYLRLNNKPSINGVELAGDKSASELNLLSNSKDQYTPITLESADRADFLLVLGQEATPKKIRLGEITSRTIQTKNSMPDDLEIGSYIFLLKEENSNGSN